MIDHCLVRKKRIHSPSLETLFKQLLIVMDGYEQCCGSDDLSHVHQKNTGGSQCGDLGVILFPILQT